MVLAVGIALGTAADSKRTDSTDAADTTTESADLPQSETSAQPAAAAPAVGSSTVVTKTEVAEPQLNASPAATEKKSETAKAAKKPALPKVPKKRAADVQKSTTIGDPLAAGKMRLLQDEIIAGIRRRGITDRFAKFQSYAIGRVNSTAGAYTGSELTGNCRLHWYEHLMQNLLAAPAEAEQFTRKLHTVAMRQPRRAGQGVGHRRTENGHGATDAAKIRLPTSADQAMEMIKQALSEAQVSYCAALAPLNKPEIRELQTYLVPVLCTQNQVGHTLADRGTGRMLCDLMEKMDRQALHEAAEALAAIGRRAACWSHSSRCPARVT